MTSLLLSLALLAQCPNGQCSLPTTAYYPQFVVPQVRYQAPQPQPQFWYPAYRPVQVWQQPAYYRVPVAHRNGLRLTTPAGGR